MYITLQGQKNFSTDPDKSIEILNNLHYKVYNTKKREFIEKKLSKSDLKNEGLLLLKNSIAGKHTNRNPEKNVTRKDRIQNESDFSKNFVKAVKDYDIKKIISMSDNYDEIDRCWESYGSSNVDFCGTYLHSPLYDEVFSKNDSGEN